ncbi:MAG: membrane protein insertion efficiency factor YidD [Thermoleophilaceae bacterium]|nr:membrane protein insertion efficiency factor YidD [Thermoleophilaceae bacterium]
MTALRRAVTLPVRLYQRFISPAVPKRCKYHPTCSEYAVQSVRTFGILRGLVLASWRLLRCNPWSHGGVDHPEDQTLFRSPPRTRPTT